MYLTQWGVPRIVLICVSLFNHSLCSYYRRLYRNDKFLQLLFPGAYIFDSWLHTYFYCFYPADWWCLCIKLAKMFVRLLSRWFANELLDDPIFKNNIQSIGIIAMYDEVIVLSNIFPNTGVFLFIFHTIVLPGDVHNVGISSSAVIFAYPVISIFKFIAGKVREPS